MISALNPGVAISGELCAAISNCPPDDSLNFAIHYGWNCGNYPTSPYDSTAICEYSTFNLGVAIADTDLGSIFGKRYESPYTLCSTILPTTCFQSNEARFVYPYQIVLDSIAPGLQIVSGSMSAVHNRLSLPQPQSIPFGLSIPIALPYYTPLVVSIY
ncbi:MAG: hypothetical protein IPG39_01160 [Bacteroidetes bacterium]|nr:hypothetical protein [Bacteroidota bacterium]